jgi:hypothetical protein
MRKTLLALCACAISLLYGVDLQNDITGQIPEISQSGFRKIGDVAQYKMADWSGVVGMARGISLDEAFKIANSSPQITFFFYTKGGQMILEKEDGSYRIFRRGDTVFFTGEPWWGSAPGLADGYIKAQ